MQSEKQTTKDVTVMGRKLAGSLLRGFQSALNWFANSSLRAFVVIFILAFGIRAYTLKDVTPWDLPPSPNRELGAIAGALVETGQFANPYVLETGPTAHLPPVHPAILALVYYLFRNTLTAGYVYMGFIIATNATMYAMAPWVADRLGVGKQAGFIGGMIGAFMVESDWSTHGEGLAGLLLGLMLVAFLKRWGNERNSLATSLIFGLGIGASFHVQPVLLLVFLGCFVFEIGWRKINKKLAFTCMLALGAILACVPWAWRNYIVFHEFFFIRSNLGLELRMGNHKGATVAMATMNFTRPQHPRTQIAEARKVQQLGEMEYMRQAKREALAWIWENPLEFLKLTFMRFIYFWFGPLYLQRTAAIITILTILAVLGIRRAFRLLSLSQLTIILVPLLTYPLIYYLVPYLPRYRTPIDWLIFILAGVEIWHWISSMKTIPNLIHEKGYLR